ncbi:MAG: hypothetical protein LBQ82_07335 [Treponema sp.]|jgi:hypothetical protein|nr:hypothetical protein [Treponema sp.]
MVKKGLVLLILAAFAGGGLFAQDDGPNNDRPNNTITVDIGPTIIGIGIGAAGKMISDSDEFSSSGFGIGAQYEYQLFDALSFAGRFAYLGGGLGFSDGDDSLGMRLNSFSIEGHARFYPFSRRTFFLDGMLGYGYLGITFEGTSDNKSVNFTASRSFFKLGAKLGWRIDFGNPGGFIFEPSLGYYGGIGLGKKLGDQLAGEIDEVASGLNDMFGLVESFIFIGGPRLSLAFGWRF